MFSLAGFLFPPTFGPYVHPPLAPPPRTFVRILSSDTLPPYESRWNAEDIRSWSLDVHDEEMNHYFPNPLYRATHHNSTKAAVSFFPKKDAAASPMRLSELGIVIGLALGLAGLRVAFLSQISSGTSYPFWHLGMRTLALSWPLRRALLAAGVFGAATIDILCQGLKVTTQVWVVPQVVRAIYTLRRVFIPLAKVRRGGHTRGPDDFSPLFPALPVGNPILSLRTLIPIQSSLSPMPLSRSATHTEAPSPLYLPATSFHPMLNPLLFREPPVTTTCALTMAEVQHILDRYAPPARWYRQISAPTNSGLHLPHALALSGTARMANETRSEPGIGASAGLARNTARSYLSLANPRAATHLAFARVCRRVARSC